MSGTGVSSAWDPSSLIQADLVLPAQLEGGSVANRTGEFELLWAVFADGVQTYCREILRGSTTSLTYREVERWIFRPSSDAITSFSSLCELFGIEARKMRRALLRCRDQPSDGVLDLSSVNAAGWHVPRGRSRGRAIATIDFPPPREHTFRPVSRGARLPARA